MLLQKYVLGITRGPCYKCRFCESGLGPVSLHFCPPPPQGLRQLLHSLLVYRGCSQSPGSAFKDSEDWPHPLLPLNDLHLVRPPGYKENKARQPFPMRSIPFPPRESCWGERLVTSSVLVRFLRRFQVREFGSRRCCYWFLLHLIQNLPDTVA